MLEAFVIILMLLFPAVGMAWADSVSTQNSGALTLSVDDTVNAWADDSLRVLGQGLSPSDSFAVSDGAGVNLGQLLGLNDSLVLSDGATLNAGGLLGVSDDSNNWDDSIAIGRGIAVDDSFTLADQAAFVKGYLITVEDDLANWAEDHQLLLGEWLALSDDASGAADAVSTALGTESTPLTSSVSDSANNWGDFSPITSLSYVATVADQLPGLADAVSIGIGLDLSDSAANWADQVETAIPLGLAASDSFAFTDFAPTVNLQYAVTVTGDAGQLADSAEYGSLLTIVASDNLAAWADSASDIIGQRIVAADSIPAWNDTVLTFPNAPIRITPGDNTNHFLDPAFLLAFEHQLLIDESINNWQESVSAASPLFLPVSDSADIPTDGVTVECGLSVQAADSTSQSDEASLYRGYGFYDSFGLVDETRQRLEYQVSLDDDAGYADDSVETYLASADELSINVSDVLTFSDSAAVIVPLVPLADPIGGAAILPSPIEPSEIGTATLSDPLIHAGLASAEVAGLPEYAGGGVVITNDGIMSPLGAAVVDSLAGSSGGGISILAEVIPSPGLGISLLGE